MSLSRLVIEDLRCIERADLTFARRRSLIVGPNGAGKTTILEAIHLLGRGRSFRTRQNAQLVRRTKARFTVFGEIRAEKGDGAGRVGVGFEAGRLEGRIDGVAMAGLVELARRLPVYVVDPRVHQLIEAGPSERRRFMDAGVFHVEQGYLASWRGYRRALSQRNAALKSGHGAAVDAWTAPLVAAAVEVDAARSVYVEALGRAVGEVGERLLGVGIGVRYLRGWRADETLEEALERHRSRDSLTGVTQAGPHRADLAVDFDEGSVRERASRGQQKLVAAALILGQVAEFARRTGRAGTLLVDDPAAELDDEALERLLAEVDRLDAQQIVTGLRLAPLRPRPDDGRFHVERGVVQPML